MNDAVSPAAPHSEISRTPATPWVPVVVASGAATMAALWLVLWLLAVTVLPSALPQGVELVRPSGVEIVVAVSRRVGAPLLAVGLMVMTWRYGLQGRATACWIAGLATVCVSVTSILL